MARLSFRLSLAPTPEFRSFGALGSTDERVSWIQPSDHWQLHFAIHGGAFTFNGRTFPFEPYTLFVVPPGSRCSIVGAEAKYDYVTFAFIPKSDPSDIVSLPFLTPVAQSVGAGWELEIRKCLNRLPWSRASICAFANYLLWHLASPEHEYTKSVFTEEAEKYIEARLGERLRVSEICEALQISHSQLARHFLRDHSLTPLQYIRERRSVLAHELLTTTAVPIKAVAARCGMPDADQFCKLVRDRFGCTPRRLRQVRAPLNVYRENDPVLLKALDKSL
ncbi:MAG: helix-turn-helix transcriptional regulator [Fimbriimonadaceae bacterium]|nr:helix-turn-helix transcriptional regulator [Fimbriimonadaceae bacterium]QYK59570.1 MAG: helix-turn-helix transcriptional regulator [Fimbriimonadaceae bacterium]